MDVGYTKESQSIIFLVEKRPRDEQGRYKEFSELDEKIVSARLRKGYREKLVAIAKKMNMTVTELAREVLENYANEHEQSKS